MRKTALMEILRSHAFSGDAGNRECLDEMRCSRLIDGQLTEPEREAIVEHLANCRNCLDLVAGVMQLQHDDVATVPASMVAAGLALRQEQQPIQAYSRDRWQTMLAVAASLILVVGALIWQYEGIMDLRPTNGSTQPTIEESPDVRISPHDQERLNIIFPTDQSNIDPENFDMRWSPVDRSVFYEIQLLSDDGDVVWQGRTEHTSMQLPQDLRFDSAGGYYLWVKAHMSNGKTIKSKVVFIRLEEDGSQ